MLATLKAMLTIATRNLFASFLNIIVGMFILAGTFLVVLGSSLLDSVDRSMSQSIIGSVAGHIQVYSGASKGNLALYGDMGGDPDLLAVEDFSKLRDALMTVDNVQTVIPMGIQSALITSGNTIDIALEKLRDAVRRVDQGDASPQAKAAVTAHKDHVAHMIRVLRSDVKKAETIVNRDAIDPANVEDLSRAASEQFWVEFDKAPLDGLEFLENRIAPLITDGDLTFLRYVGTDLDAFQKAFDRMEIVDGQAVPPGRRGLLLSKFFYEEWLKIKPARRLDRMAEQLTLGKTIATDKQLQQWNRENQTQTREIVLQLDRVRSAAVVEKLKGHLGSQEPSLQKLLESFFTLTDENFEARRAFFYSDLAPHLDLYRLRVGDTLTIKAFTRTGYIQSVNVKIYGTYRFKGLENSALAGGLSLMDLMSFRDLYGYQTADKLAEVRRLKQEVGAKMIDRDSAEAELFGDARPVESQAKLGTIDDERELPTVERRVRDEELLARTYTKDEIEQGMVLNAALLLKDPSRLRQTLREVQALSDAKGLGLKVVSWQQASGLLGQFVFFAKLFLYLCVFIIFIVAMVIINNAVMMATLQRVREIGTMRAIGAQRRFVLGMVLTETTFLGIVFGGLGAVLGAVVVRLMAAKGIPASHEALYFFFSGPRLHPTVGMGNLVAAFLLVFVLTAVSTLYPARVATRVSPLQAMQTED